MPEIIRENFSHGLRMRPDGRQEEGTIFDEMYWAMQNSTRPVERVCQTISQFHGPYGGASQSLANIIGGLAGKNAQLIQLANSAQSAINLVENRIADVNQYLGLINNVAGCQMSTPFLREFVTQAQSLHPSVNAFINQNIGQFPYFQEVSENIGCMFTIISDSNMTDLLFSLLCGVLPNLNLTTASRMVRQLYGKLLDGVSGIIEDSEKFIDSLMYRAMPYEENHGFTHPNYANEIPIAHGNNFARDVHHWRRAVAAIPQVLANLISQFGDKLRLLNQIFPVDFKIKFQDQTYQIPVEGAIVTVDRLNRMWTPREMTIEKSLKANQESFEGEVS